MTDVTTELPRLLFAVERPGDFFGTGEVLVPLVRIAIDGEVLGFPIPPVQAEGLARMATPAPYGRGGDTLVDPSVRRCGQIPAEAVQADTRWGSIVTAITADAARALGAEGDIEASLYKMLVYEAGGFFAGHRDTEKAPGMFATLVIVLPSEHAGGELVVSHGGRQSTLQLAPPFGTVRWAAFYTDCVHELRPVESGWRVALIYNLVRRAGPAPKAPDHGAHVEAVRGALGRWASAPEGPSKLVIPLEHRYTPAELSFRALKNGDAAAAAVLVRAAAPDFEVRLAMVSIEEQGAATETFVPRGRWGRWEPDPSNFEVIEVHERSETVGGFIAPGDRRDPRGDLPLEEGELCPPGALDDEEPDEKHYHEATGNEGATFERTYRSAALVVWPRESELALILQGGRDGAIRHVERLLTDGETADAGRLAELLVASWPQAQAWGPEPGELRGRMLAALLLLGDKALLQRFIGEVIAAGSLDGKEHDSLVEALLALAARNADLLLSRTVTAAAPRALHAVALLVRVVGSRRAAPKALVALVDAVAAQTPREPWRAAQDTASRRLGLGEALRAVAANRGPALHGRLARAVLDAPHLWDLDEVVIPALFEAGGPHGPAGRAMTDLRDACVAHLRARVALPLVAPPDERRSTAGLSCRCGLCRDLRAFLDDPRLPVYQIKSNAHERGHVESAVRSANTDVSCLTIKQGSPHTLRLTKTQASYDRRVARRRDDLELLEALTG